MTLNELKKLQHKVIFEWIERRFKCGCPTEIWKRNKRQIVVSWDLTDQRGISFDHPDHNNEQNYAHLGDMINNGWEKIDTITKLENGMQQLQRISEEMSKKTNKGDGP